MLSSIPPNAISGQSGNHITGDIAGTMSQKIGSGKHAQTAIAWQTIKWSFGAGAVLSLLIFFRSFCATGSTVPDIIDIWKVFVPIITLVLGYVFGKGVE